MDDINIELKEIQLDVFWVELNRNGAGQLGKRAPSVIV
jgi:hypothetical protein